MKELVRDVIDAVLCIPCKEVKANPYVKDAMPEQYLRKNNSSKVKVNMAKYDNNI